MYNILKIVSLTVISWH